MWARKERDAAARAIQSWWRYTPFTRRTQRMVIKFRDAMLARRRFMESSAHDQFSDVAQQGRLVRSAYEKLRQIEKLMVGGSGMNHLVGNLVEEVKALREDVASLRFAAARTGTTHSMFQLSLGRQSALDDAIRGTPDIVDKSEYDFE
jgi:hypothetical protein